MLLKSDATHTRYFLLIKIKLLLSDGTNREHSLNNVG